ncbi:MAG: hypothetical protein ABSD89_14915 [Halobacteriota archaeon]|jgi:hypothetical protein
MKTWRKSIKSFDRRWKISYDDETEFKKFRSRVFISFDRVFTVLKLHPELAAHYLKLLGAQQTPFLEATEDDLQDSMSQIDNLPELMRWVQYVFWLRDYVDYDDHEGWDDFAWEFFKSISYDIDISKVPVSIKRSGLSSDILFYPKGAKLLDEKLVNDTLEWLNEYPLKTNKYFESALSECLNKRYERSINDMRLSLEILLKHLLNNNKSLEKQTSPLGIYLKEKNVPADIMNTYSTILNQYSRYQNEFAKHDDHRKPRQITEEEAEFIVYETGVLMRFLIQLDSRQTRNL